jgi:hypothetical protein
MLECGKVASALSRRALYLCMALLVGAVFAGVASATCTGSSDAHAEDYSNEGSTPGTAGISETWGSWYATPPIGFSDEAVWVGNPANDYSSAIEGGFYTGSGVSPAFTNSILPYWTINNGHSEHDFQNDPLAPSTDITMEVTEDYWNPSELVIDTSLTGVLAFSVNGGGMTIPTPRQNFMQGEADSCGNEAGQTWMGGGGGEGFNLLYQSATYDEFYYWGTQSDSTPPSPYYDYTTGAYTFTNGGY